MPATTSRRHLTHVAATALLALSLTGGLAACGSSGPGPDVKVPSTASPQGEQGAEAMSGAKPTGLRIPSAGVDAKKMLDLTTDSSGELGVPDPDKEANTPGWWNGSVTPGEKGVSVLVAHYDTKHGPALMKDLKKIKLGDTIEVPREDGSTAKFKIREIQDVDKKNFPTDKVYGASDRPELRLLTCGGEIKNGHRTNNIIYFADLVK
ncbi:class F sortase [Streptomyces sp. NPDC058525]|uniref:class F sortase n=1 Tax=Streptomyces sp. NPDC058525 TaxID=3346538 RepID=UPI00364FAA70